MFGSCSKNHLNLFGESHLKIGPRVDRASVSENGTVKNGRVNVHHDCTNGRLRMTMDGFRGGVKDHTFSATMHWRINDNGLIYSGVVTVSGRFESPNEARGGFVNSVSEKPAKDELGTCPSVHGTWDAAKD